jgi:hypothetical protein
MDEPFGALDALTRETLYGDIQRIWEARRKTIIFVTHNVREAACLGDRVILFSPNPGRIRQEFSVSIERPRDIRQDIPANHGCPQGVYPRCGGSRMKHAVFSAAFFVLLILSWEAIARTGFYSTLLLPVQVGEYLWQSAKDGTLWTATFVTMRRLLVGYLIGILFGVPLGLLTARLKIF